MAENNGGAANGAHEMFRCLSCDGIRLFNTEQALIGHFLRQHVDIWLPNELPLLAENDEVAEIAVDSADDDDNDDDDDDGLDIILDPELPFVLGLPAPAAVLPAPAIPGQEPAGGEVPPAAAAVQLLQENGHAANHGPGLVQGPQVEGNEAPEQNGHAANHVPGPGNQAPQQNGHA